MAPQINQFEMLNRELYAYTAMLRQLAAKYDDPELNDQIKSMTNLYEEVTAPTFHVEDLDVIHEKLDQLRLCTINLHVQTVNHRLVDIQPICIYLSEFVHQVKQTIGECP
ncbi:hypothetical protein [Flavonifractor sp. An306]|uniref:hypothetical protein n=1 Tax=Flavonifractor sp. An306 TaxID=1965629 RepID=UPI00174931B7|nr:hypothetical protein [Flavonifractor sp. An306]